MRSAARMTCRVSARGALRQGQRSRLRIAVRVNGQTLDDMKVSIRGAGVRKAAMSNAAGNVTVAVRPARAGTLRVSSGALNVSRCVTSRRVAAARRATGVAGTGTGGSGAALSGRAV